MLSRRVVSASSDDVYQKCPLHGTSPPLRNKTYLTVCQLSREEESETTDAEVTKEDQDKINAFSRLHNRSKALQEELSVKQV
jgi:hypothetical protein